MNTEPESRKSQVLDVSANVKALTRIVVLVATLLGGAWLVIRYFAGEKTANQVTSVVLHQPIELKNSIENLPANSFKGVPLSLPYSGTLQIEVTVRKGNDIDLYLVAPDQIDRIKGKQQFSHFTEFEAQKTHTYKRAGRIHSGAYYLVMFDKTLGILSQSSSDVQIHARLEP